MKTPSYWYVHVIPSDIISCILQHDDTKLLIRTCDSFGHYFVHFAAWQDQVIDKYMWCLPTLFHAFCMTTPSYWYVHVMPSDIISWILQHDDTKLLIRTWDAFRHYFLHFAAGWHQVIDTYVWFLRTLFRAFCSRTTPSSCWADPLPSPSIPTLSVPGQSHRSSPLEVLINWLPIKHDYEWIRL